MRLRTYSEDLSVAYLELADHPHRLASGIVKKTVELHLLIPNYQGPRLALDFNERGNPIGLEIIYPHEEFYGDSEGEEGDN
ncbi:MAG: DUF2283 domain-containing protein [Planctomycetota bacterium]